MAEGLAALLVVRLVSLLSMCLSVSVWASLPCVCRVSVSVWVCLCLFWWRWGAPKISLHTRVALHSSIDLLNF